VATETAAELLVATVDELSRRAPAVVAAAAGQLGAITLGLRFGDGSAGTLRAHHSRLLADATGPPAPDVVCRFDERSMNLLFDLSRRPVDQVLDGSLDVTGPRHEVLAVWRTFALLSQRASGLRSVQTLWRAFRDRRPELWGTVSPPAEVDGGRLRKVGWRAIDYLEERHPDDADGVVSPERGTLHAESRVLWDGEHSESWWSLPARRDADLQEIMAACKERVRLEMEAIIPLREPAAELYDLMRIYPARPGKGLRPTLTMATCAALGGSSEDAARAAAAIELFHNGFLIHDDISDGSTHRRGDPTLHEAFGMGLAVNAGDGMHLLAVDTVLSHLDSLGLARTLGLIHEILHMCRETVEGQAIELGWIRNRLVPRDDADYFHMSTKKTGWYTCITPCRLGAVCARETDPLVLDRFVETFRLIGIAFQIQDDVLNLVGEEALYGKEPLGDLLEGKRTVMLIHLFRSADRALRRRLEKIALVPREDKVFSDAEEILAAMRRVGSIDYAIGLADRLAHEGVARFEEDLAFLPENEAKAVLRQIANYVTTRPL
jgi:geranylgeranyl diphosphate synthase, type II